MKVTQEDITGKLIELLKEQGSENLDVKADSNLVEEGFLDSIAFLNFILSLEDAFDLELDFSELEPSEFTSIEKLTNLINNL